MRNCLTKARQKAAFAAGDLAAWASKATGRGTGESIRGAVISKIAPNIFDELLEGKRIAVVTGTNGKTTTTHLLAAAMRASFPNVVTNSDGGNLKRGIVSALSKSPNSPIAVLEVDEQVVPYVLDSGNVEALVMLNISRDQLDRHHEINSIGKLWRDKLTELGQSAPTVIANVHDPLVVWSALASDKQIWVDMGLSWEADSTLCPECGTILSYEQTETDSLRRWSCSGCGLAQPDPDVWVDGQSVQFRGSSKIALELSVPGRFNRGNAACALAAAKLMSVDLEAATRAMTKVESPAGRFSTGTFDYQGHQTLARLALAKNPAAWAENMLIMDAGCVVLAIDSAIADGADVSWLWDVEFEALNGKRVIVTGPRCHDLAVRLSYSEIDHEVIPDVREALRGPFERTIDVLATYSAFLQLCHMGGVDVS